MPPAQGTFRGGREKLAETLRQLPGVLSGRVPDPTGAAEKLLGQMGLSVLGLVHTAFLTKAQGGTDAAGIKWDKLQPRSVAYGRAHLGLTRKREGAAKAGRAGRPLLTESQDRLWRGVFARTCRRLQAAGDGDARGNAAALAWALVKRAGGKTVLGEYGSAPHLIGVNSGRLLESLTPGTAPGPANADQVFRVGPGEVDVGTSVPHAEAFSARRPLWPEGGDIPGAWADALGAELEKGVADLLAGLTGG